ncbi:MAG: type II secretion system major pseudopilin GspG [Spirochaetes bacterium]|nr:type II secretion system major pseudopilin GspG [Spirochaetota bacterium]
MIKRVYNEDGFSLIEIMIVVVIMSILVGLIARGIWTQPDKARVTAAKVKITQLSLPLLEYQQTKGGFPSTEEGLNALVTEGLIKEKDTRDPWGNPYIYRFPGENESAEFEIISLGADGKEGGTGVNADIKSWELDSK